MGNKIGISPDLSGSSTSEDVEETKKGTKGNGYQEDIDRHPTVISIIIYYMNKKTLLFRTGFIPLCDYFPSIDEIDRHKHYVDLIEVIGVATTAKVSITSTATPSTITYHRGPISVQLPFLLDRQ